MLICLDHRTGAGCGTTNPQDARACRQCGMALRFALQLQDPGALIGRYRIVSLIGHGGFGAVYQAEPSDLPGQIVALKETFDPQGMRSFQAEFAVLSALHHPNLPRYDELFEADGNTYLVMEYVPGQSLQELLDRRGGPLLESQVLGHALQLCDVLAYLHACQPPILHRDIKPANVRLTPDGLIKLVDFGLLKQVGEQTRHTIRGFGTPAYAPIEQYGRGGEGTDARSDIYSLGALLYHLLTGQEPPAATERIAAAADPLPAPRQLNTALSPHVSDAVVQAMALSVNSRFVDTLALKRALLQGSSPPNEAAASSVRSVPSIPTAPPLLVPGPPPVRQREPVAPNIPPLGRPATPTAVAGREIDLLAELEGHSGEVRSLGWRRDGLVLISAGLDGRSLLWAGLAQTPVAERRAKFGLMSVAWHHDGERYALGGNSNTIEVWHARRDRPVQQLRGYGGWVNSLAYDPASDTLASAGNDRTAYLWDGRGKLIRTLRGHDQWVWHCAWHPRGGLLATTGGDGTVHLWGADGRQVWTLYHGAALVQLAWSPDGAFLAGAGADATVTVWRASDYSLAGRLIGHERPVSCLAWHPAGHVLASSGGNPFILLWHWPSGQLFGNVDAHDGSINALAWHPDGTQLASAGDDAMVRVWEVR